MTKRSDNLDAMAAMASPYDLTDRKQMVAAVDAYMERMADLASGDFLLDDAVAGDLNDWDEMGRTHALSAKLSRLTRLEIVTQPHAPVLRLPDAFRDVPRQGGIEVVRSWWVFPLTIDEPRLLVEGYLPAPKYPGWVIYCCFDEVFVPLYSRLN